MHLSYMESAPQAEVLLLQNQQHWRVELFVLRNNDDSYSLVALSGHEQPQAERVKSQGPYATRDQALGARSAVAAQLQTSGFTVDSASSPHWRLQAQRNIREIRTRRQCNTPNCRFDPRDVY